MAGLISAVAPALYRRILRRQSLVRGRFASRSADHVRRGLIFQVAARMQAVSRPPMTAATGIASASAAVAAQPIEEKASANVASRDDVWRRRNWLRRACTRNHSCIAVAEAEAMATPSAVTAACSGEANSRAATSGAKIAPMTIRTTSIFARVTRVAGKDAVATRSAAPAPEIVSDACAA